MLFLFYSKKSSMFMAKGKIAKEVFFIFVFDIINILRLKQAKKSYSNQTNHITIKQTRKFR